MRETDCFSEDASLPAQYWEHFGAGRNLPPEKRLLFAVLEDAVRSYRTLVFKPGARAFAEVEAWFADDETDYIFSFLNICDVLGLSPSQIRRSLLRPATSDAGHASRQSLNIKWPRAEGNAAWSRIAPQSGHVADSATPPTSGAAMPPRSKIAAQL